MENPIKMDYTWGDAQMDGVFYGKSQSKIRMITGGWPYFRKPPDVPQHTCAMSIGLSRLSRLGNFRDLILLHVMAIGGDFRQPDERNEQKILTLDEGNMGLPSFTSIKLWLPESVLFQPRSPLVSLWTPLISTLPFAGYVKVDHPSLLWHFTVAFHLSSYIPSGELIRFA